MPKARTILLLLLVVLVFLFVADVVSPGDLFDLVLLQPMLNFLVLLSKVFFGSFGLAILVLTVVVRLLTLPLMTRQLQSTKAMRDLQPKMKELRKKHEKDAKQLQQETMKLYKEHGVNPLGCAFPMLAQLPIWIALYQSVIQGLGYAPENLFGLSKQLYSWSAIQGQVPLNSHFLWLDLGSGDVVMAVLVGASMWVLQKMSVQPSVDPQQEQMTRMMNWLMPLMFGFFALTFPSGLSLYWFLTNVISSVIQYRVTGWGSLTVPSLASLREGFKQPFGAPAGNTAASGKGGSGKDTAASQPGGPGAESTFAGSESTAGGDADSHRKKVRHGKYRDKRKVRRRSR